jgi:hypothetical protein
VCQRLLEPLEDTSTARNFARDIIENKATRAEVDAAWDAYQNAVIADVLDEHPEDCTCRPNSTELCQVCQATEPQLTPDE